MYGKPITIDDYMNAKFVAEPLQRGGKVLSAVYRVGPYRSSTGTPSGYAIRLLIDPASAPTSATRTDTPATMSVADGAFGLW